MEVGYSSASFLPFFPQGSFGWLVENSAYVIILGFAAFYILVYGVPKMERKALMVITAPNRKGKMVSSPLHPHWFVRYAMLKILSLVVAVWGIFLYLLLSTGWRNPFAESVTWYGITTSGWVFDLVYARANNTPSGAHILSWIGVAGFGLVVCYKAMKWRPKTMMELLGDPFQGIAALIFLGGLHELTWIPFYYAAYGKYLNLTLLPEALRDVFTMLMMALFVLAFWKYPNRVVPLKLFKWPFIAYFIFLIGWFVIPPIFGGPWFPITTLNNPQFGTGPYEETPYFAWWWVNGLEVASWLILWVPCIIQVIRYSPVKAPSKVEYDMAQIG